MSIQTVRLRSWSYGVFSYGPTVRLWLDHMDILIRSVSHTAPVSMIQKLGLRLVHTARKIHVFCIWMSKSFSTLLFRCVLSHQPQATRLETCSICNTCRRGITEISQSKGLFQIVQRSFCHLQCSNEYILCIFTATTSVPVGVNRHLFCIRDKHVLRRYSRCERTFRPFIACILK